MDRTEYRKDQLCVLYNIYIRFKRKKRKRKKDLAVAEEVQHLSEAEPDEEMSEVII